MAERNKTVLVLNIDIKIKNRHQPFTCISGGSQLLPPLGTKSGGRSSWPCSPWKKLDFPDPFAPTVNHARPLSARASKNPQQPIWNRHTTVPYQQHWVWNQTVQVCSVPCSSWSHVFWPVASQRNNGPSQQTHLAQQRSGKMRNWALEPNSFLRRQRKQRIISIFPAGKGKNLDGQIILQSTSFMYMVWNEAVFSRQGWKVVLGREYCVQARKKCQLQFLDRCVSSVLLGSQHFPFTGQIGL